MSIQLIQLQALRIIFSSCTYRSSILLLLAIIGTRFIVVVLLALRCCFKGFCLKGSGFRF